MANNIKNTSSIISPKAIITSSGLIEGTGNNDSLTGYGKNDTIYGYGGNDTIKTGNGNNLIYAGTGNNHITTGSGNDTIYGSTNGQDFINADAGNDLIYGAGSISGGKGNDTIHATVDGSSDVFYYRVGDGKTTIYCEDRSDNKGIDTIRFVGLWGMDDIYSAAKSGNNLIINVNNRGDQIILMNYFKGSQYRTIKYFEFARDMSNPENITNRSITGDYFSPNSPSEGAWQIVGTYGDDELHGGDYNDTITAIYGENELFGHFGNDLITGTGSIHGGKGNDTINVKIAGSKDTIFFAKGDGQDVINSLDTAKDPVIRQTDTLVLENITRNMLSFSRQGNNLVLNMGSGDQIIINNYFKGTEYQTIHRIEFGYEGSGDVIEDFRKEKIWYTNGTDGKNETIIGTSLLDYINAGAGNDNITGAGTIIGGKGNDVINIKAEGSADTLIFNKGDGKDVINSLDKTLVQDTLQFGDGITAADLSYERKGNNLIIKVGTSGEDQITINNYFKGKEYQTLSKIEFLDSNGQVISGQTIENILDANYAFNFQGVDGKNNTILGTQWAGKDHIIGGDRNDNITGAGTIIGGVGNDVINLKTVNSSDTIIFNVGDGKDVINSIKNGAITDTLRFGAGITREDLTYERKGNNLIIYIKGRESGDQITLTNYFKGVTVSGKYRGLNISPDNARYQTVHKFEFTDSNGAVIDTINDIYNDSNYRLKIEGTAKNDNILGATWASNINAGDGNDKITAVGASTIMGGKGNDTINIQTSGMSNTIIYHKGDGKDVINSFDAVGSIDELQFIGITKDMLTYQRQGNNLIIIVDGADSGDQITITNFFKGYEYQSLHLFVFRDENGNLNDMITDIRADGYLFNFQGMDGKNNTILGTQWAGKDHITGGDRNDNITGAGTIIGGVGNDVINIKVEGSVDTLIFNKGDGKDIINSLDKTLVQDTLQFGDGISAADLSYERKGNNLIIKVGTSGEDQITINNYFKGKEYQTLSKIEFLDSNGQVISGQTIENILDANYAFNFQGVDGKNNTILGTQWAGKDHITGGDRNDNITGAGTIIGGVGNDVINIKVEGSVDTLIFNKGDGKDIINSLDKTLVQDTLQFGDGISAADLSYERKGNNLIIKVGTSGEDQITINNYFKGKEYQTLSKIEFLDSNGQVISGQTIENILDANYAFNFQGVDGKNNTILGTQWAGKDHITGGDRNDNITGAGTIIGGVGNDVINIKVAGSVDTLIFNKGDGKDVINSIDKTLAQDTLQFGDGITVADLSYERKGNNLIIKVGTSGEDQITINNYFKGKEYQTISKIEFLDSNGQVISGQTIENILDANYAFNFQGVDGKNNTILGTQWAGKDHITGGDRNDNITGAGTIIGGVGNDVINIKVAGSSDVIRFDMGDGKDVINSLDTAGISEKGHDVIEFGNGISTSDVSYEIKGKNLILKIGENDQITISNYFAGANYQTIEKLIFADGSTWDLKVNGKEFEIEKHNISGYSASEPLSAASLINQTDSLINAMASFTPSVSSDTLSQDKPLELSDTLLSVQSV